MFQTFLQQFLILGLIQLKNIIKKLLRLFYGSGNYFLHPVTLSFFIFLAQKTLKQTWSHQNFVSFVLYIFPFSYTYCMKNLIYLLYEKHLKMKHNKELKWKKFCLTCIETEVPKSQWPNANIHQWFSQHASTRGFMDNQTKIVNTKKIKVDQNAFITIFNYLTCTNTATPNHEDLVYCWCGLMASKYKCIINGKLYVTVIGRSMELNLEVSLPQLISCLAIIVPQNSFQSQL